jgi:hypothetical protein
MDQQEVNSGSKDSNPNPETFKPEWISAPDGVFEGYANFIHVNWTLYDVRIRFAQIIADPSTTPELAPWVIEESAAISLPWGQAKYLHDLLARIIGLYEKVNGEIKTPILPKVEAPPADDI